VSDCKIPAGETGKTCNPISSGSSHGCRRWHSVADGNAGRFSAVARLAAMSQARSRSTGATSCIPDRSSAEATRRSGASRKGRFFRDADEDDVGTERIQFASFAKSVKAKSRGAPLWVLRDPGELPVSLHYVRRAGCRGLRGEKDRHGKGHHQ